MSVSHPPSPSDGQLPSTSSWPWEDHQDFSPFGNLPPTPTTPNADYAVPAPSSSRESEIGGRAMIRKLAAQNIAEWNGACYRGGPVASYQQPELNRWDSRTSLNSVVSACSVMSNMSAVSGLSIRTDITAYSERDLTQAIKQYNNMDVKENRRPSPSNSADETEEEKGAREMIEKYRPEEVFQFVYDQPDSRVYRKMMIRIYKKKIVESDKNGMNTLASLSAKYPEALTKILQAIIDDVERQSGKIRLDALTSLAECKVAIDTTASHPVTNFFAGVGYEEGIRDRFIEKRLEPLFEAINVPDMEKEKSDEYEAECSVNSIKLLYQFVSVSRIKKVCKRKLEWAKRLMRVILMERDMEPRRKMICLDVLRRMITHENMLKIDGIIHYLDFLNKTMDYSLAAPGIATCFFLFRVQKTEELLATVIKTLLAMVSIPVGTRNPDIKSLLACKELIVREGGIQILASWLDHGSNRVIYDIGECLMKLADVSGVAQQDLKGAIRRAVQLLGNNCPRFVDNLQQFVIKVALVSERHRNDFIAASGFRAFIHMISTWTEARALDRNKYEPSVIVRLFDLSQALLDLSESPDCEKHETPAIDQLLAEPRTLFSLLRLLSFDFAYEDKGGTVSSTNEAHLTGRKRGAAEGSDERSAKYTKTPVAMASVQESNDQRATRHFIVFWNHERSRQAYELVTKANAAKLLNRLAASQLSRQRTGEALGKGLNLSNTPDPLWKETMPIMLLRRLNELGHLSDEFAKMEHTWHDARRVQYRYKEPHSKDKIYTDNMHFHLNYIVNTADHILELLRTLHADRECFEQIKSYLTVSGLSMPRLNPVRLLIKLQRPHMGFSRMEAQFAGRILTYLDAFLASFIAGGGGLQNSLRAWVANENLHRTFCGALEITRQEGMIQEEVYRRLIAHLSNAFAILSPPMSHPPAQYRVPLRR